MKDKWIEAYHANINQKKAGVAILISDKVDFIPMENIRGKKKQDIMIKGSILLAYNDP